MRISSAGLLGLGLPLLLAAAPDNSAPDANLRLTPTGQDVTAPIRLPQAAPAPPPQPLSFGLQRVSYPGNVEATFDVVYGNLKGFRPLTLDLYQPQARDGALPLVVFVHGGGWNGGDTRHAASFPDFPRVLAALAAQGYVVASVSYRLSGEARFPGAVQDVKAAIRWLRGQARPLNIDISRAAVWGDGAGGQLAALVGVTCGVSPFEPDQSDNSDRPSNCVQAVIDWGGATDLESLGGDKPEDKAGAGKDTKDTKGAKADSGFVPPPSSDVGDFLGCEPARCAPMLARLASPLAYISATSPAFLIQHGAADSKVPSAQSQKLYDALRKQGVPAELLVYPELGTGFAKAGAPDAASLKAVQDKISGFLTQTFPPAPIGPRLAQPRGAAY